MVYISLGVYTAPCSPATAAGRAHLTMTARVTHVGMTSPVTVHPNTHYTEPPSHRHGRHAAGAQTSTHIRRWLHQARHTQQPCNRAATAASHSKDMCQLCLHLHGRPLCFNPMCVCSKSPDTGMQSNNSHDHAHRHNHTHIHFCTNICIHTCTHTQTSIQKYAHKYIRIPTNIS
jgi:hypothetical protein